VAIRQCHGHGVRGFDGVRDRRRARIATPVAVALALAVAACSGSPEAVPSATASLDDDVVTIASFDFPESELLAEIYGQALEAAGFEVELQLGVGPRELVQPALVRGLVEFVPEYAGTALEFMSEGPRPTSDAAATHDALQRQLRDEPMTALAPAPAQDANAIVVTAGLAEDLGLATISDLRDVAPQLVFGGPPGCPERPLCLGGLQSTYGLSFESFMPLDVGGPLTHQALDGKHIDVALLFSTDPRLADDDLVVLADDRSLQPAENVTPLVRTEVVARGGDTLVEAVDAVSARLTTDGLRALNAEVAAGTPSARVAAGWLRSEGLA
jgi:osmoprotectant transport system substrate-binding protein